MATFSHGGVAVSYTRQGEGEPMLILHGNTGASRMLNSEIEFYSRCFEVIAMDLIGHGLSGNFADDSFLRVCSRAAAPEAQWPPCQGLSERLAEWPVDFWHANARVALALCASLGCPPVHVLGTSGGAIVALNMALECPTLVRSVIADSFAGGRISANQAEEIVRGREQAKSGPGRAFWTEMHGADWEQVVDADSRMLLRFARERGSFFRRDLESLACPVLITASLADELIGDARAAAGELARRIPDVETEFFESGGHPAMLSNADAFRARALRFLAAHRDTLGA